MTLADLRPLHQKIVLVKSARDQGNPPAARRGTIEVHDDPVGRGIPVVQIAVDFPPMFSTPAHHHTITLDAAGIERLLASECNGTFEITVDEPLDPAAPPASDRAARAGAR